MINKNNGSENKCKKKMGYQEAEEIEIADRKEEKEEEGENYKNQHQEES